MSSLRYAFRQLGRRSGLSFVIVAMLALGIGATTAMFSLFYQVLLEPLPVPEPGELVTLSSSGPRQGGARTGLAPSANGLDVFSYPMFRDLENAQDVFTGLAGHYDFLATLTYGTESSSGDGALVSGAYFDVLNLRPALGRLIGPQDEPRVGESQVVVLAYDYWQSRFGGDRGIVGETLTVNNQALEIVGVAPEGFTGVMQGWQPHVFVPITLRWLMQPEEPRNDESRLSYWLYVFGRLRPGTTLEQAEVELNGFYRGVLRDVDAPLLTGLSPEQTEQFLALDLVLKPGARGQTVAGSTVANPITLLLGATVLVLAIVCVNVANLLLARGASRAGEMAVRASLGASHGRLVRQLLTESAVLAAIGGLLSLPVALATLRIIAAIAPLSATREFSVSLDPAAVLFAAAVTVTTVILFGLAPALQAGRTDPGLVIKGQAAQSVGGRGMARLRGVLIGSQIAFSMVLLVLAGLFIQSLANVARIDLGMRLDAVVRFSVSPLLSGYSADELDVLYRRITEELAAEPGVRSVASAPLPLMGNFAFWGGVAVVGVEDAPADGNFAQSNLMTSPGYFETLSIPLLAGRDFTSADSLGEPRVAIVNETFVRRFDLGTDPVGKSVRFSAAYVPGHAMEIVGVVGDARFANVKGDIQPQFFTPRPPADETFSSLFFYVRSGIDPGALMQRIPRIIERVDPALPIDNLNTLEQQADTTIFLDRIVTQLSATFAGLATVLAAIGLYGMLAYLVAQRTREMGLRLALGANPGDLRLMLLKQVCRMALIGGAIGLVAALGVGRAAQAMLYGLSSHDPLVLTGAAAVLGLVVLAAAWLPARAAAGVTPMEALRYE